MDIDGLSRVTWQKSSYSNGSGGDCVEVAMTPTAVGVHGGSARHRGSARPARCAHRPKPPNRCALRRPNPRTVPQVALINSASLAEARAMSLPTTGACGPMTARASSASFPVTLCRARDHPM
ncbi:DUF397 domain-containing protein [Saccharopolyspora phatthalungensis]|uniref:DUF397 domain-containing protein n=1 Tax=Saccharopolyspora phatthalungensis TaxID=664693 RepID=UPI001616DCC1|nr:DUF397 domain-containing protein [Saccharopolyspora phatthalungensis]